MTFGQSNHYALGGGGDSAVAEDLRHVGRSLPKVDLGSV
jgi:hypothetical protein